MELIKYGELLVEVDPFRTVDIADDSGCADESKIEKVICEF